MTLRIADMQRLIAAAEACDHKCRQPGMMTPLHYETLAKRERDGSWTERVSISCKVCKQHLSTRTTTDVDTPQANSFTEYHDPIYNAQVNRVPGGIL